MLLITELRDGSNTINAVVSLTKLDTGKNQVLGDFLVTKLLDIIITINPDFTAFHYFPVIPNTMVKS